MLDKTKSLLLIIDLQQTLLDAMKLSVKDSVVNSTVNIIKVAKIFNVPIVETRQYPKGLGDTELRIKSELSDAGHFVFDKTTFDALLTEDMLNYFSGEKHKDITDVVVAGTETHICVLQTVLSLLNSGKKVTLLADCVCSRKKKNSKLAISEMRASGAAILPSESVMYMWCKDSKDSNFKNLLSLVK